MEKKIRVIALYLPQFHPIPENDKWWGKGFTEWTNVGKAKRLFRGHYQPRVPSDLGYYDLRVPEAREAQAMLAKEHGIEGFCYWHYWFGNGKRLLERPFNEVVKSGSPDFPFCLAWANESWKGFTHGIKNREILIEQLYPGEQDYKDHFYALLEAFKDKRYITVDGKPVFLIYKPLGDTQVPVFMETWRKLALENGLPGIYFIGQYSDPKVSVEQILETGFDAVNTVRLNEYLFKRSLFQKIKARLNKIILGVPLVYSYKLMSQYFVNKEIDSRENVYPSIVPGWDHSPRSGKEGLVMTKSTPELFEEHVAKIYDTIKHKDPEHRIAFVKSWNEWAEGNYLEPDLKWSTKYLEALNRIIK